MYYILAFRHIKKVVVPVFMKITRGNLAEMISRFSVQTYQCRIACIDRVVYREISCKYLASQMAIGRCADGFAYGACAKAARVLPADGQANFVTSTFAESYFRVLSK